MSSAPVNASVTTSVNRNIPYHPFRITRIISNSVLTYGTLRLFFSLDDMSSARFGVITSLMKEILQPCFDKLLVREGANLQAAWLSQNLAYTTSASLTYLGKQLISVPSVENPGEMLLVLWFVGLGAAAAPTVKDTLIAFIQNKGYKQFCKILCPNKLKLINLESHDNRSNPSAS